MDKFNKLLKFTRNNVDMNNHSLDSSDKLRKLLLEIDRLNDIDMVCPKCNDNDYHTHHRSYDCMTCGHTFMDK